MILLLIFLGLFSTPIDRYPDPSSQILWSLCLLDRCLIPSLIYRDFLPSTPPRYLSIYRATFYINTIEVRPDFEPLQIFGSLSLSSFDPRPFFSLKSFFPFHFRLHPSLLHLVSALDLSFFSFFMYFMHVDLGFKVFFFGGGGGTWCFCVFVKNFGMGFGNLILHAYALHYMFIITMFHAFRIMWWLYLVSVVTLD